MLLFVTRCDALMPSESTTTLEWMFGDGSYGIRGVHVHEPAHDFTELRVAGRSVFFYYDVRLLLLLVTLSAGALAIGIPTIYRSKFRKIDRVDHVAKPWVTA